MTERPDELDADRLWTSLGALPTHDLAPERAEALRQNALAALGRTRQPERATSWSARRLYLRALEPAWVAAVAALQLALCAERLAQIYGG
jgi:hypothetical protein